MFWFPSIGYNLTFLPINESAPKNDWDVLCRSTDSLVRCPLGSPHTASPGLVLQADLVRRADLPAGVQQSLDLSLHLGHAPGDGRFVAVLIERVGRFGARPAQAQEQPVRGVRLVSAWYSTSNRIFTTSRIAGTSQNSA